MTEEQRWLQANKDKEIMSAWETGRVSLKRATDIWNARHGTRMTPSEFATMARGYGFNRMLYELGKEY